MSLWRAPAQRLLALPPSRLRVAASVEWPALRDGVRLATRCLRPLGVRARGTLLVRGAGAVHAGRHPLRWLALRLAEQGLVVVLQECRGMHASEGTLAPFAQEAHDGADTIAWLAEQSWFAAPLSLAGAGYAGYAAWAALGASPLPVARLLVARAARDPYAWLHAGGALRLETSFALAFALAAAERGAPPMAPDLLRALRHRPLYDADRVGARRLDWLRDWLARPVRDAAWDALVAPLPQPLPRALLLARWDEDSLAAQRADAEALRAAGGQASLEIAPACWDNRAREAREGLRVLRRVAAFLLADAEAPRPPLRAWDAGAERWVEPTPGDVCERRLHLHAGGRLDAAAPAGDEGEDRFVYDPADATPSDASRGLRGDVLAYESEPLPEALELAGCVRAELCVASAAPATDFCVDLLALDAAGAVEEVAHGITRCRFGAAEPERVRRIEIDCGAACFRVAAGGRLRVEIASAAHPRFDRATNTEAEPAAAAEAGAPVLQRVFHDAQRPSCVVFEARVGRAGAESESGPAASAAGPPDTRRQSL